MNDSFWAGGAAAYHKGLRKHYKTLLADLRHRRSAATGDTERSEVEAEIERMQKDYDDKLNSSDDLLF